MIEKMAGDLIDRMVGENLIDMAEKAWYQYAFISLAEKCMTIGTILLFSICMKTVVPTILFLVFFLELRKRTGGFHFCCFYQCYLATILVYWVIVIGNAFFVRYFEVLTGICLLAVCIILSIGSVNHPNIHMDTREWKEAKKAARILVLLEGSIICGFVIWKADRMLVSYMMVAVILCASLLGIAKIVKQEVR